MSGTPPFVHLHNHTNFSLLDGATRIHDLMDRCVELGMPAVALTDHGNMFAAVQFYRAARQRELKPILGMEAYMAPGSRTERSAGRGSDYAYHLPLLALDDRGYRNLMKLSSIGYLEGFYYRPRIDRECLAAHADGLIATTGCLSSEICQLLVNGDTRGARTAVGKMLEIFGPDRYFVELQDHGLEEQRRINPELVRIGREFGLRMVATNDCHYLRREDVDAHDVLLCIQTGKGINDPNRMRFPNHEFYLKSPEEMAAVFADLPEALTTTVEIAERCKLDLEFDKDYHLPQFPVPAGATVPEFFGRMVREGFDERMRALGARNGWRGAVAHVDYESRLRYEMAVIEQMKFSGYFLIVWDFIRFAKEQGIPVGPGRGSAAGSLVAWSLGITEVDPLRYGLVFERFLNPERKDLPDIDIDFCMRRRGEVIEYVANKYGHDRVAHIITFGTMAAKAAIRDVGRALEMPYGDVDRIAKMIPETLGATIEDALEKEEKLRAAIAEDTQVERLVSLARQIEGQVRHASTHAAGVVISDEPLTEYVPLYKPPSGQGSEQDHFAATQYPMGDVVAIGLLKMDFLGLRTLTLVHDCAASIARELGRPFRSEDIPLDDAATYRLFAQAGTSGIFQFESSGMREYLRKLKPTELNDLIAMNALYRPGPIGSGMIDDYIKRKHDPSKVTYELPELEPILAETFGVIVYQEQVMKIASSLAGFTMGQADMLRKAMGKKKADVMEAQRDKFLGGARERGVPPAKAEHLWEQIDEFAGYGFNKSHSAAYGLLAYQTGWLKANHPVHFMAALLTSEQGSTDKVVQYINECRGMGIEILPPDVNESHVHFTPVAGAIRFGLAAIKGVGEGAVHAILEARERIERFSSLRVFCEEVDQGHGINRKTIESLIKAGAMDSLVRGLDVITPGRVRAILSAQLDEAMDAGSRKQRDRESGQNDLFGTISASAGTGETMAQGIPECAAWEEREVLAAEREALGFFVTGHPIQRHAAELAELAQHRTSQLIGTRGEVCLGAMVVAVRPRNTRAGDRMATLMVEDMEGQAEVVVFPKVLRTVEALLALDAVLLFRGKTEAADSGARIIAAEIETLEAARQRRAQARARSLEIAVDLGQADAGLPAALCEVLERHRGSLPVSVELQQSGNPGFRARLMPNRYLQVSASGVLVTELEALAGVARVRLLT